MPRMAQRLRDRPGGLPISPVPGWLERFAAVPAAWLERGTKEASAETDEKRSELDPELGEAMAAGLPIRFHQPLGAELVRS